MQTTMRRQRMRDYFYLRSGKLHHVFPTDLAVDLSEAEAEAVKKELNERSPEDKQEVLGRQWGLLTGAVGKKPYDFTEFMDRHCSEKRRRMEAMGL